MRALELIKLLEEEGLYTVDLGYRTLLLACERLQICRRFNKLKVKLKRQICQSKHKYDYRNIKPIQEV